MDRRRFVAGAVSVLAAPLAAEAQQPGKVYRIGMLLHDNDPSDPGRIAFREGPSARWVVRKLKVVPDRARDRPAER